jgi:hypothetical protein
MAGDHGAQRPEQEADPDRRQRHQQSRRRAQRREENRAEDECGGLGVDEEVEPFDRRADARGEHDTALLSPPIRSCGSGVFHQGTPSVLGGIIAESKCHAESV